jgi:hypothetical protein
MLSAPDGLSLSHRTLKQWMLDWFSSLEEKELAIILMPLYHMWLARNEAREAPMIEDPDRIARRVLAVDGSNRTDFREEFSLDGALAPS